MKKYFTPYEISEIKKDISIVDYLAEKNYLPVYKIKNERRWLYSSIGMNERTPSFSVDVVNNTYADYSGNSLFTGECGDIIRLCMHLEKLEFIPACNFLLKGNYGRGVQYQPAATKTEKDGIIIESVSPIVRPKLLDYISERCIARTLADKYLQQIVYTNNGRKYYSLGFINDLGGYALRSPATDTMPKGFKAATKPNYFTTVHTNPNTGILNLFEGFFSMLSILQFYNTFEFQNTTIVLNSVTGNFAKLIPNIPEHIKEINVFFDNDDTGIKYVRRLRDLDEWQINNQCGLYYGFKDMNDKLVQQTLLNSVRYENA